MNKEAEENFDSVTMAKQKSARIQKGQNGKITMGNEINASASSASEIEKPKLHPLMNRKRISSDNDAPCVIIKACDLPEEFKYLALPRPSAVAAKKDVGYVPAA